MQHDHAAAAASRPVNRHSGVRGIDSGLFVRVASVTVTLLVWEWYGRGVDPIFLSYPTAILEAAWKMVASGELQAVFWISLRTLIAGLSLAILGGALLGLLMGRYRMFDRILDVQINALYAT